MLGNRVKPVGEAIDAGAEKDMKCLEVGSVFNQRLNDIGWSPKLEDNAGLEAHLPPSGEYLLLYG